MPDKNSISIKFNSSEELIDHLYLLVIGLNHSANEYGVHAFEGTIIKTAIFARETLDSIAIPDERDSEGFVVGLSLKETVISGLLQIVEDKIKARS